MSAPAVAGTFPDQTQIQKFSESKEWRRLLHYRPQLWGGLKSTRKGQGYFLAADGVSHPVSELKASLEILFQQNPSRQCDYLARTDLIVKQWPELSDKIVKCEFFENWKSRMGAKTVSLIFASSYLDSAASSFGHTFLRLENPKNILRGELLDYGVNFSARTGDSFDALYALYGLTGFFPGQYSMLPYHQMIKSYTNLEGRDLWEYQLNLSEAEVDKLLKYLFEVEKTYSDYYFLDDNCAYEVLWALQVVRPELNLVADDEPWVIPLDSVKIASRAGLVSSKKYRPSLMREWEVRFSQLSPSEKSELQELLKNLNSSKDVLDRPLSTAVLEAAQVSVDLNLNETASLRKEKSFQLSRARARRPKTGDLLIPEPVRSPEDTHDSSHVGLGAARRDSKDQQLLTVGAAFHSWLSDDSALSPFSEMKVLNFEFRNTPDQFRLEKAVPLRILSTRDIDRFFQPISWGAELSYDHYLISPNVDRPLLKGQVGYSLDFWSGTRGSLFIFGGVARNIEQNISGLYGIEARVLSRLTSKLRMGLISRTEIPTAYGVLSESTAEMNYDISRQWEFHLQYGFQSFYSRENSPNFGNKKWNDRAEEYGATLIYNFIVAGP